MLGIVVTIAGAVLSLVFTVLAIYAAVLSTNLYLPTPILPHILAISLPVLNFLSLLFPSTPPKVTWLHLLPAGTANTVLSLLDTVLITFSASELRPQGLLCSLEQQWNGFFMAKNEQAIRGIQDQLLCCGFRVPWQNAWPFPDHDHGARACTNMYHRERGCMGLLMGRERFVLSIWLAIGVTGLIVKAIVIMVRRERPGWLGEQGTHRYRQQGWIAEEETGGRFLDNPPEESSQDQATLAEGHRSLEGGNVRSDSAAV